jgi:hypothetical protein
MVGTRRFSDRRSACAVTGAVLAAAAIAIPAAAQGAPTTVTCGQTITHSVTLANDLTNCAGHGLVIGADGITVDLNGHTIDGVLATGCDFPGHDADRNGVDNRGGFDGVTVQNGTVRQFDSGVAAGSDTEGMSDSRVHGLTLRDNRFAGVSIGSGAGTAATADNRIDHNVVSGGACSTGLDLNTGVGNRFDKNRVTDVGGTGIAICCGDTSDGNVVADNRIARTADRGILVFETGAARIVGNVLSDIGGDGIGIIFAKSSGTVVAGNRLTRVFNAGIAVFGCVDPSDCREPPTIPTGVRVVNNTLEATGDGILLGNTDGDVVRGNTVAHAASFGDPNSVGVGIELDGVSDTLVAANDISDSGQRLPWAGIAVGREPADQPSPRPVSRNTVARNSVERQSGDGIFVAKLAIGTTLLGNEADRNGADGIHVLSASTTLTRNQADRNALLGIEAVAGVTDGGGNRARGNGTPAQCTGVAC